MLGVMVSFLLLVSRQCGYREWSRFNITLCPFRHGQSNASHFGTSFEATSTAAFRGNFFGISSAASTVTTTRQDRPGTHSHHGILTPAMFAPSKAVLFRPQSCRREDCNNVFHEAALCLSISLDRDNATKSRSAAERGHIRPDAREVRLQRSPRLRW